jgi:hypothetical protein
MIFFRLVSIICRISLVLSVTPTFALEVAIAVNVDGEKTPTVVGLTNLPDDSKLLVTLSRKRANYSGQANATVKNGKFSAGPFSAFGKSVPPGDYEIEVVFPLAATQPAHVQRIVGSENEKLKGRLVDKGKFGTVAKRTVRLNIGGSSSPDADKQSRVDNEASMKKWRQESCEWIARVTKSVKPIADCVRELERK